MGKDLAPEDIKRIRGKYGLSQQAFARLLGLGEASVVRYENGQKPSKANANLIRAAEDPTFMLDCLERDGNLISQGQRDKTEKIVYAMVTFNESGEVMDINELYEITLQQEILNEQTANLMGEVSNLLIDAKEKGDDVAAAVYEDVLMQLAYIKPTIIYRGHSNKTKLSEIRGQIECLKRLAHDRKAKAA